MDANKAVISGQVQVIKDVESIGQNGTAKQVLVVGTDEERPQMIPIEFWGNATGKLNLVRLGDMVNVTVNVRGREWKGKYYPSLNGWKIEILDSRKPDSTTPDTPTPTPPPPPPAPPPSITTDSEGNKVEDAGLPF